ncbi:MAG: Tn3 family transposase [Symploca sp. SIO1C2]|nr:Tn3 family transposase [Symploca sp. SIO1C2]
MQRHWQPEELIEHWTLLPTELELLTKKTVTNRLAIALLLKYFQYEGRFPTSPAEIPRDAIRYVAELLKLSPDKFDNYDWQGRTIKAHRALIRDFLGVTEATVKDAIALSAWLETQILAYELKLESIYIAAYNRLRFLKIEPPTPERLERIVRSAIRRFEDNFCDSTAQKLSTSIRQKLDELLETASEDNEEEELLDTDSTSPHNTPSPLAILKSDPGRLGMNSLISESAKLKQLRQLELPDNLFPGISTKVLHIYKQRVAVEPPRELRRHPDNRRYTLLAAFCWLRTQEITDKLVDLLIQIIHRIGARAERRVTKELLDDFKKVSGKTGILFQLAEAAMSKPEGIIQEVIYPVVGEQTLKNLVREFKSTGTAYREKVYTVMRSSYGNHYRRLLPFLLNLVEVFISNLQQQMTDGLSQLDQGMPKNNPVKILTKNNGWIRVSPFAALPESNNLSRLKTEIEQRWSMTSLLDMLKETDLRVNFTQHFKSVSSRENLDPKVLQKRLLICLYGLGTNTGIKRLSLGDLGEKYQDLLYVRRKFIHKSQLRNAIAEIINATFNARLPQIWGEGTTTCASDSKKFGAWDQNLMTEWHIRYGGRGVMIYWHVEKNSACIYSQLKTCSSSEVAAMIEGLLRHCTSMKIDKNYVDSHGQSEVAFAFTHLLGFQLMPRLKGIHRQKLYRPFAGQPDAYPNLQPILTRPINWDLIRQQYDQMIKYATALRLGTAETEAILKRFNRSNLSHPTYRALAELGKVIKTIFLCKYLHSESLRREVNEALNVVESWNNANGFIFFGKGKEIATNRMEDQEIAVLSLHLLQSCLVYINTLMIQEVLSEPVWMNMMQPDDLRALTPLIWSHVNPYGIFRLDLDERLPIQMVA